MPARVPFRNPYPIPDVSSEGFWIPPGPVLGDKVTINDRRWSTKLAPHERLFAHHTLNSIRRDQRLVRTKAPNDALDLALTSTYVHNEDTLVPKVYVSMQPEALGRETWRVLRNELKTTSPQFGVPNISGQSGDFRQTIEQTAIEREPGSNGSETSLGNKFVSGFQSLAANKKDAASRTSSATKMASRYKMAAGANMAARATSAPAQGSYGVQADKPHKYAGRTGHDRGPGRIERIHPSSLKLAIDGPHVDQTRAGYSRKDDGTFYGVC